MAQHRKEGLQTDAPACQLEWDCEAVRLWHAPCTLQQSKFLQHELNSCKQCPACNRMADVLPEHHARTEQQVVPVLVLQWASRTCM